VSANGDSAATIAALTAERDRLQESLGASYSQLSEVTTRVLAMSEAADSMVETHDVAGVSAALLAVCARSVGARTGGVFLSHGEGAFDLLAVIGLDPEAQDALGQSLPDLAVCQFAEDAREATTAAAAAATPLFAEWRDEALAADPAADVVPLLDLYVPLVVEDKVLGVLALGPAPGGRAYAEDDRLFLDHVARQGALALDRALLFEANEDRLRDLDALLRVSRELSSTLDLDHVLLTAVNLTGAIAPRERAVLALFEGGKLRIRAVSDFPRVDDGTAERLGLARLLEYLGYRKAETWLVKATEVEADPAHEGRDVWQDYFGGDMRGAFALLLKDDQGPVGVLLLEAYDERAFDRPNDRVALGVLVGQLSVAIRNAELYRQLPMVSALAPLAEKRRAWRRMDPAGRTRLVVGSVLALLVVAVVPWPIAVGGDGQVLPAAEVPVRAAAAGLVRDVQVRSGERVAAGQPLARLEPQALGSRLAALRAEADRARFSGAAAADRRDAFGRRLAELEGEGALARLGAAEREDARANLLAPIDGFVLTTGLGELEGAWLEAGDVFAQVSPLDTLRVEIGIPETEIARVRPGQVVRVKVLAFPDRQFKGRVTEVGWQGEEAEPGRPTVFKVVGRIANPDGALRSGMTGRGRVDVGSDTLLARFLRGTWRWLRLGFYT
jgi:RND family efflux transporter MFP subunit